MNTTDADKSKTAKARQYALAAVLGVILLYFGGEWVVKNVLQGPVEKARDYTRRIQKGIKDREKALARARQESKLLDLWESQSLPSDTEQARSLYQAWLLELVDDVQLDSPSVNSTEPASRKGVYYSLSFSVRGRGTLEQLTRLLFAFYQTDLLHQIRSLTITPLSGDDRLDVSLAIEALVLPGSGPRQSDGATQETIFEDFRRRTWRTSNRLASQTLVEYDPIVQRNLFGIGGSPDPTDHAFLTSVSTINGEPEVWFTLRATDEVIRLRKGDVFEIGPLLATLTEVHGSDVVIEADGERWLLSLGEKLTDAFALPPEL